MTDPTAEQNAPVEKETIREREVIVTGGGNGTGGNNMASTLMAIVGILVVLVVGYFIIQAISDSDGVEIPTEFDVNINDGDAPAPAST